MEDKDCSHDELPLQEAAIRQVTKKKPLISLQEPPKIPINNKHCQFKRCRHVGWGRVVIH